MEVQIELTKDQHDQLIEWFGDDEHARQWVQSKIDERLRDMAAEIEAEKKEFEEEILKASERFPEVSFAKLTRIAKRFYDLGKKHRLKE